MLSDYELRRKKGKGGSGRLPSPKLKKKYRAGRRKAGEAIGDSDTDVSHASDEGAVDIDQRRMAATSKTGRKPKQRKWVGAQWKMRNGCVCVCRGGGGVGVPAQSQLTACWIVVCVPTVRIATASAWCSRHCNH